jgi:hypothetical protein
LYHLATLALPPIPGDLGVELRELAAEELEEGRAIATDDETRAARRGGVGVSPAGIADPRA